MWETSEMGPFDGWPTGGGGFEHFYGFFGAETDYYRPDLYQGTTPIEPPKTPEEGYHFDDDIATHTIEWVRQQNVDCHILLTPAPQMGLTLSDICVVNNSLLLTQEYDRSSLEGVKSM